MIHIKDLKRNVVVGVLNIVDSAAKQMDVTALNVLVQIAVKNRISKC